MATGILILARLGSTRLSNKHLIKFGDKTFIEWLASRFLDKFQALIQSKEVRVIIATSTKEENKKFEQIFSGSEVEIFYGSDENIPLRQLQCAEHYGLENIISIDGDDILCSLEGTAEVLHALNSGEQAAKTTGLPLGMNIMGYKTTYLRESLNKQKANAKFETGWGRIFETGMTEIPFNDFEKDDRLRFTLDYEQDAAFFSNIIAHFGDRIMKATDKEIIQYVLENKVFELNASLNGIYWDNFNNLKQAEL